MGVVPVHSLPTADHRIAGRRGLGYNERPKTGTALLAVCMVYIVMLVGVQGKFTNSLVTNEYKSTLHYSLAIKANSHSISSRSPRRPLLEK